VPLQYHLPDRIDLSDPWILFCVECSKKMKITRAMPAQEGRETRTYECACGHSERIDLALDCGDSHRVRLAIFPAAISLVPKCDSQPPQGTPSDSWTRFAKPNQKSSMVTLSVSRPEATTRLSTNRTTEDRADPLQPSVRDAMLATVPKLRAFAISLSGNVDRADDLVQETLLRAIAKIDSFQPGTNMSAWLFTILHNRFRSEYRKRRREVEDIDGSYVDSLKSPPEQHTKLDFEEFRRALAKLSSDQREALLLVGASGFSYDEAATICETAVGTIKSRVNRARTRLAELLALDAVDKFGPDATTCGILTAGGPR
jgi:RNA polymerase sigma-70 factor, ECF subfamily